MRRKIVRKDLSIEDYVTQTVALTERVLTPEEIEASPGTGATAWRTTTTVAADLGATFMQAEPAEVASLDFTADNIIADKERIGELERGRAAVDESGAAIDRALSATKDRLAGRMGRLQGLVASRVLTGTAMFRAHAAPLMAFASRQTDKQTDRRRETTELRTTIDQISAERDLANKLGRGDKITVDDLLPLAARTGRRSGRTRKR